MPANKKGSIIEASNIAANMITVNNYFFAHWIKEIDIKCYGDDLQILPTDNPTDIYRYFDKILKLLLRNVLKTFEITLLHSRKNLY